MTDPAVPPIYAALGKVAQPMKRGRFSEAVAMLEDAVARYGGVPGAYADLASACLLAGDLEKGAAAANEAIRQSEEIDAYVARAFGLLGALNYLRGFPGAAGTAFTKYRSFKWGPKRDELSEVACRVPRLYTPSLLETASRCGAEVEALLRDLAEKSSADLVWYPDGTVLVRGAASYPFYEQVFLVALSLFTASRG